MGIIRPGEEEKFLRELCSEGYKRVLVAFAKPVIVMYYVYPDDFEEADNPWNTYLETRRDFKSQPERQIADLIFWEHEDLNKQIVSALDHGDVPVKVVEVICKSEGIRVKTLVDKGFSK